MDISERTINNSFPPFVIAEMSGNHGRSLERAKEIVEAAARVGADAVKIQTYTADSMTLDIDHDEFMLKEEGSPWNGTSLYQLYERAHTPLDWHEPIFTLAKELGIICFSSVFDDTAVDYLENLNVPAYKIASAECVDLPLIRKVSETKKPLIVSVGMATVDEINEIIETIKLSGNDNFALLKCTSAYPSPPDSSNISTISHMKNQFGCEIGISDHTMGIGTAVASISFGATIIEKHFTLDREDGAIDSFFSLDPSEFTVLVDECRRAWASIGNITYGPTLSEKQSILNRRSLYIGRNMKAGDQLTTENLRRIRPGFGLAPRYYDELLGKKVRVDVKKGTPVSFDIF